MKREEQTLQIAVAKFLRYALPEPIVFFHVPNGGARSKVEGAILKAMGTRPGMPDLGFILPTGVVAWCELKAKRGVLTPAQKDFRDLCRARGVPFAECKSIEEVQAFIAPLVEAFGHRMRGRI